jgi:hypothetical protein
MFGFISFAFKIIFTAIISGAVSYAKSKEERTEAFVVLTSLIGVLSASIVSLTSQFPGESIGFSYGLSTFAVLVIVNSLTKKNCIEDRMILIFSSILGITIGSGFVLYAIVLCVLVYFMMTSSRELLNHFEAKNDAENETSL